MSEKPNVVLTHHTSFGQPRLVGHRLTVGEAVSLLDGGLNPLADFRRSYPDIPDSHIMSALRYCMAQQCKQDIARWNTQRSPLQFCHGCTLRREAEGTSQEGVRDMWVLARALDERLVPALTSANPGAGSVDPSSKR